MPYVKLDTAMLDSSVWPDKEARDIFITTLLMAKPIYLDEPTAEIHPLRLDKTGYEVPPGWYGFVEGSGIGIIIRAGLPKEAGLQALLRLSSPDPYSRSEAWQGRRMIRIDGGYLILNYALYRDKDHTAKERMRRHRHRKMLAENQAKDATRNNEQSDVATVTTGSTLRKTDGWLDGRRVLIPNIKTNQPSAHSGPVKSYRWSVIESVWKCIGADLSRLPDGLIDACPSAFDLFAHFLALKKAGGIESPIAVLIHRVQSGALLPVMVTAQTLVQIDKSFKVKAIGGLIIGGRTLKHTTGNVLVIEANRTNAEERVPLTGIDPNAISFVDLGATGEE